MTTRKESRTDQVSRVILAPPRSLYRAHLDREMLGNWRAPEGVRAEILAFDGRLGGEYLIELHYPAALANETGKTGPSVDRFRGRFEELVPDEKIVEQIQFESDDPAFARPMIMTTTLRAVKDGTKITVTCSEVPAAIAAGDHISGITAALRNLAMLTE
jgi:uncharacterized protein YndB with AHSA1/START domain